MIKNWILIGTLAVVTYLSRVAGLEVMSHYKMGPTIRLYFTYVPIAIISALLVGQIFVPAHGGLSLSYPVLVGCFFTALSMRFIKAFLPSIIIGIACGLLLRYLLLLSK